MSYFNLDIHACYARSNATCRMGLKSTPKFTKLRFKKSYKAETTARVIKQVDRGFAGAAGDFKYIDLPLKAYAFDTTGTIYHYSPVPTGVLVTTRTGKSFRPTSLQLRGYIYNGITGTVANPYALYLVWDNQPEQALPALTDIFATVASIALVNRDNASRFKILRKWKGVCTGCSTTPASLTTTSTIYVDEFIKLPKDCIVTCTAADTTGAIGNTITGALFLLSMGDSAPGTASALGNFQGRLNFIDL